MLAFPSLPSRTIGYAAGLLSFILAAYSWGAGLDRNGVGARSMGQAGATLADETDAVTSAAQNPAALGFLEGGDLSVTLAAAWAQGNYRNGLGQGGELTDTWGVLPEIVWRQSVTDELGAAFSIITDTTRMADWYFRDPPGGATGLTTYGLEHHRSAIINVRAALSLGWQVTEQLSIGASLGATYTRNELATPYTFQTHPALAGLKTLLDLQTEGYGVNGDLAIHWRPRPDFAVALTYRTPTHFDTEGTARGDVTRQLVDAGIVGVPGGFSYDAKVATNLPQKVALGASWKAQPRLRVGGQVEWVGWSQAYDTLEVRLANGSNGAVNGAAGSSSLQDNIALNWKDSFVYRAGLEYDLTPSVAMRFGYTFGSSPVPGETLLPTTAAISEHALAIGLGCKMRNCRIDFAYQYDLPAARQASAAAIRGGEYRNSRVEVEAHWLGITTTVNF